MAKLNIQQQNLVKQLRQAYPELESYSDEKILSLYNQQLNNVQLTEAEQISIMNSENTAADTGMGLKLESSQTSVSKAQEEQLKTALTARLDAVKTNIETAEKSNGFLGSMWSGFKNLTGIGDSSDKVREQQKADIKALQGGNIAEAFKQITGLDYTVENVNKFLNNEVQTKSETALNGYTEGQDMASDVIADMVSGIAAVAIYTAAVAAAPFTGGASIAVGVAAAGVSAAAIKTGIKYADAKSGGRGYTADNLKKDLVTGAFSGVLAPITGGMGGAVGKTVATKVGIQAVKQVGKEVAEEAAEQTAKGLAKTMLTNPTGYEYVGGTFVKRGLAFAAETATDGAVGGAVDNAFRTAYDGGSLEDVGDATIQGFVGGAIMSPIVGGGMKFAGKGAQKIFGKNDISIDAEGNRVRVNEDGTVVKVDADGNEILSEKLKSFSKIMEDKELLKTRLKELFESAENEKLHNMSDFQLEEIVSIIDKENIFLLESILKRNDIQDWDVQDLLKSCCNDSKKVNKLNRLLSCKRQDDNVFKPYDCIGLAKSDYDEALLNKMLLKEVDGNYKYGGYYIYEALQLCSGSKDKVWAMQQIIEKDFNVDLLDLNKYLSLITPENIGVVSYLKEINMNSYDLQKCLKFCKSTKEQLPKLQEINARIDASGTQKLEMTKNFLKNPMLTELLYKDPRFFEDSYTTTAIISKYEDVKEIVDILIKQKNSDNPEFLKYNPSEMLDFINSNLTVSDLTPTTLKMLDDIRMLKFEGEQLFSKPVSFMETLKNNKEYEFIWTDILQNIKNGNLQLNSGYSVKTIIENFEDIPENYQTKILDLFLGENKKLSVYNLYKIVSTNREDNIFSSPYKLEVFDDLLTRIQNDDFTNTEDLNCIGELLSSILGPIQVNWYAKLIGYNQKNNSRFSLTEINELIKMCHNIDAESFDEFVNYKETDGVTPRFNGPEISKLLDYSGFWLNNFKSVAELKNSDGTYKFNGEAIYALLRLGNRTKELGVYDKLLSIEVDGKAKFQGKSCEDLLMLSLHLKTEERKVLLDLMENKNISEKVLLNIFEADYPGGPILVKDIPWEKFAKYGLLEDSNGDVNHKLIQTLKYYWSGDTSYIDKIQMFDESSEMKNYMKNISKEGLNEVAWYKQILEKAENMSDAEIKFYFDFGKQAIYDNYHGRWSELNDNKINITNSFLSSLLDSKTTLTLDSFSISEKITLLNYLKDINITDFKSPNSFSAFLQKYSSAGELKEHIMKDLEVSLKQPGKDITISQEHISSLLKGDFSALKEKYPFITNDVIAKYNKIMLKTNNLEGLTSKDQVVLKFAVLFEKIDNDETLNSIIARNILENNGMTSDVSERVFNLLRHKNWLAMYKEGKLDINDIAVLFREPNDLELAKLLCAEDFLDDTNRAIVKDVETTLNNIYSTAPIIKPTTIPYEQRYLTKHLYNGTEYKIIDFTDPKLELSKLGFSSELDLENVRFLTHFINIEGQDSRMSGSSTELINLLCDEMNDTSLSVALINPNHIDIDVMGRNCAVILEPMGSNYAAAYHEDFTSPLKKGFQEFKEYLIGDLTPEKRIYVSNVYKKLLNLNDSEYVDFYKALSSLKDISNIKSDIVINKGLSTERMIPKEEVVNAINSAHNSLTNVTGNWNELIIYNPKIKALLYKIETDVQDNLLENCPKDILDFARKHDIPIVVTK